MNEQFDRLQHEMNAWLPRSKWDSWFLCNRPHPAKLPSPYLTWLLVGTFRYANMQAQAVEAYYACGGRECDYAIVEWEGQSGPDLLADLVHPEWTFRSDAPDSGWEAVHRATGHRVQLEIPYSSSDMAVDAEALAWEMYSIDPADVFHPLQRLHGAPCMITSTFRLLCEAGVLREKGAHKSYLEYDHAPESLVFTPLVEQFCQEWQSPENRLYLAALINDWFTVHDLAVQSGDTELQGYASKRAEICKDIHLAAVVEAEENMSLGEVLCAKHLCGVKGLHDVALARIDELLREESVIEILTAVGNRDWAPVVRNLLGRSSRKNSWRDYGKDYLALLRSNAFSGNSA